MDKNYFYDLPDEISAIIYDYVKLAKFQQIYWEKLYSPASLIVKKLIKIYSDYDKIFHSFTPVNNELIIIIKITTEVASQGFIQKNIYILMDEYIDNLGILKKHLDYHFRYSIRNLYYICMIHSLEKLLIN